MLALLFLREALKDLEAKQRSSGDDVITGVLMTPMGTFGGILESQLELLQMPYVTQTGQVGRIPMKKLYLDHLLEELAANLHSDVHNLFDGSREFIIAADVDIDKGQECCPSYYATTTNSDDKESMQHLESSVMQCLTDRLDSLPSNILPGWNKNVLHPLLTHIKSKIESAHSR